MCDVGIFQKDDPTQKPRIEQVVDYLLRLVSDRRFFITLGTTNSKKRKKPIFKSEWRMFSIGINHG